MTPYTYAEGRAVAADDPGFATGPIPGAMVQDVALDHGFLSDRLGAGFTLIAFGAVTAPDRPGLNVVSLPANGTAADIYGARDGSAYLVRPDLHIAARWRTASAETVRRTLSETLALEEEPV